MEEDAIQGFLAERREGWLKKKIKADTTDEEQLEFEKEADVMFSLNGWLPNAAKRAGQLSMVTHPCKFAHPSSRTTSIIAKGENVPDGFLRTGNAKAEPDVFGNAAAIDVYKFLSLRLKDGKTILNHLENETIEIKTIFNISASSFDELRDGFLAIKEREEGEYTSPKVKQVFFPVEAGYHLLSILTPSGLMFELRKRIDRMRFSEETLAARKDRKSNTYNEAGADDLTGLHMIGYGGTKPQNISVLNSANGGKAYLLPCLPPMLSKEYQRLPSNNFFMNLLWPGKFKKELSALHHRVFEVDDRLKNEPLREKRDGYLHEIVHKIIEQMWGVRMKEPGWSDDSKYLKLPFHQKIWLDDKYQEDRQKEDEWLNQVATEFSRWLKYAHRKMFGKDVLLDDSALTYFKNMFLEFKEELI